MRDEFTSLKQTVRKLRVAVTPRGWILKTRLPDGTVVLGENRRGFGGRGIYIFRERIEPEFESLHHFLGPSDVFVDVGANTGIYTIKAASIVSRGTVVALEPFAPVAAVLQRTIDVNGLTNVRLRVMCAGRQTEASELWCNHDKPNMFSMIRSDSSATNISVLAVSLDDLLQMERLDRLDYLKIDAEGSEQDVLGGARNTIERHRPMVQLEVSVRDVDAGLAAYTVFQAPDSPNRVLIPDESDKVAVAISLGWMQQNT